ncbi:guanylate kinase [Compostibacter hankyongensis]|uniref:Guanylate kinase n=1 Tax=Compostibacter hankyongensis TaxID=1007089 RepID=A0ABP8FSP9_9BACT
MSPAHKIIILTAPSGAGKTTIAYRLLQQIPGLVFSVSATTRAPREDETAGKDYYFLSVADFRQKIADDAFVEYEMVYEGKYYGTLRTELERIWQLNKYPLRIIDVAGALALKEKFGADACAIFIRPPSLEALRVRLLLRGSEDRHTLLERTEKARVEMNYADRFDHTVENEDLDRAVAACADIIRDFLKA